MQFAGDRALRLRLVSVDPRPTYHGWVWLTGYVLNDKGLAVDKREVFVQQGRAGLGGRTQDWCQETPRWVFEGRHRVGATLFVGHHAFIRRCVVVRIPSLSRRSEPAPTRDENLDGRVDGRDAPVTETGQSDDSVGRPVVTDRDADQTTYRSAGATGGQTSEAERRANERAAVARAATARPVETESRGTARPVAPEPVNGTTRHRTRARHQPGPDAPSPAGPAPSSRRTARTAERDADLDSTTRRPDTTDRTDRDRVTTDRPVDPTPRRDRRPSRR